MTTSSFAQTKGGTMKAAVLIFGLLWAVGLEAQNRAPGSQPAAPSVLTLHSSVYGGAGSRSKEPNESGSMAFSAGVIQRFVSNPHFWGFDLAMEGTQTVNETGKRNAKEPALSVNLLAGSTTVVRYGGDVVLGGGFLVGMRRSESWCPESNLGFRCWAGMEPEIEWTLNAGFVGYAARNNVFLGGRVTSVSRQILVGFSF